MPQSKHTQPSPTADRELAYTRLLDAPREVVWSAWTRPEHLTHWWGPNGFSTTTSTMDVRPGGIWRFVMHGPDGRDYQNRIQFLEVVPPERLVYRHCGEEDDEGVNFHTTATFAEAPGGKTSVTLRMLFPTPEEVARVIREYGADEGGKQTLARLAVHAAQLHNANAAAIQFSLSRTFDAPRALVWRAFTDLDCLKHWWGPKGFTVRASKMDLRIGGMFHYVLDGPNGAEMWGRFVYREIAPPDRLVFINSFSDPHGGLAKHPKMTDWPLEMLTSFTFEEMDGKTTLTVRSSAWNATPEERHTFDSNHASMTMGWTGTMDQLAAWLDKETRRG